MACITYLFTVAIHQLTGVGGASHPQLVTWPINLIAVRNQSSSELCFRIVMKICDSGALVYHSPSVFEFRPISCTGFISCAFSAQLMAYLLLPYFIKRILCGLIRAGLLWNSMIIMGLRCFNISPCQVGTLICSHCSRRGFFYGRFH